MKEIILTSVFGDHAEQLDRTFTSFAQHTDAELHAFVLSDLKKQPAIHLCSDA